MRALILFYTFIIIVSCTSEKKSESSTEKMDNTFLAYYGDTLETNASTSVQETLEALKSVDSLQANVTGYVTGVCQVKGCWMILSQNPTDSTGLFVKFKDYGFFVPLDLSGSKVTIAGKAYKEVTSVDELRHYAEDEGKTAEEVAKITEPSEEKKFMAHGVALIEKGK